MGIDIKDLDKQNDIIHPQTVIPLPEPTMKGIRIDAPFLEGEQTLFPRDFLRKVETGLRKGGLICLWETPHGLPCRILQTGKAWQKGKIIIKVEFVPDPEPESPPNELDSLRGI